VEAGKKLPKYQLECVDLLAQIHVSSREREEREHLAYVVTLQEKEKRGRGIHLEPKKGLFTTCAKKKRSSPSNNG